ncbi:hypothetical protein Tco_0277253, partial [Tanacetum coccineum]
ARGGFAGVCLVVVSGHGDSSSLLRSLAAKFKQMVDSGKASGFNSIGINNVESDNSKFDDHGNYGNGGMKPISFASILKEQTKEKTIKLSVASGFNSIGINNVESDNSKFDDHGNYGNGGMKPISFASILKEQTKKKTIKLSVLSNDEIVNGADEAISLFAIEVVGNLFANTFMDEQCPKKVKVATPTKVSNDGFVEASNDVESIMDDSDSEEVENVFVEDNEKPMDGLVDDARKKVEAPPKKTPRTIGISSGRKADSPKRNIAFSPETNVHYFDRDDIEEVEHEDAYCKKG